MIALRQPVWLPFEEKWKCRIIYLFMTHTVICVESWHILRETPAKLTDFIQVSREVQDIRLPWCADWHILTDNWFGFVLLPSWIWWHPQAVEIWISPPLMDQHPLLEEGQQQCWRGHPCIHFAFSLWERSRPSNRNLQKLGEGGIQMDCVGNTSLAAQWKVLGASFGERSVCLGTDEA